MGDSKLTAACAVGSRLIQERFAWPCRMNIVTRQTALLHKSMTICAKLHQSVANNQGEISAFGNERKDLMPLLRRAGMFPTKFGSTVKNNDLESAYARDRQNE